MVCGSASRPTNSIADRTASWRAPARCLEECSCDHRHVVVDRELLDRLLGLERAPHAPARAPEVGHRRAGPRRTPCTLPSAGRTKPLSTLKKVVLPAPLGPMSPQVPSPKSIVMPIERRDAAEAHREVLDLDHPAPSRVGGLPRPTSPPISRPSFAMSRGNWYDQALRRGEEHLEDADAEEDRQQVRRDAPVVRAARAGAASAVPATTAPQRL